MCARAMITPAAIQAAIHWAKWSEDDLRGRFTDAPSEARLILRSLKISDAETLAHVALRVLVTHASATLPELPAP